MKHVSIIRLSLLATAAISFASDVCGHDWHRHDTDDKTSLQVAFSKTGSVGGDASDELIARVFGAFEPKVKTRSDGQFFYVESDGMADHDMMVGITAWQQQVPLPQSYKGNNAWRIPLNPTPAKAKLSARTGFFRGAIALAANGVPIFNPIKNDGKTDTFLAGELDEYGGHAGRGDDYHYHIAPLHLQEAVGENLPIAYALDGYPIYGLREPNGTPVRRLDNLNGHIGSDGNYHYHSSKTYPYINGGFHGHVTVRGGQVDPQPRAQSVRPATSPLRGAKIIDWNHPSPNEYSLTYEYGRETRKVNYTVPSSGPIRFEYVDGFGKSVSNTYQPGNNDRSGQRPPPRNRQNNKRP